MASRLANMRQGERTDIEPSANLPNVISQAEAAKMLNVSERMVRTVKAIERGEAPERFNFPRAGGGNTGADKYWASRKRVT